MAAVSPALICSNSRSGRSTTTNDARNLRDQGSSEPSVTVDPGLPRQTKPRGRHGARRLSGPFDRGLLRSPRNLRENLCLAGSLLQHLCFELLTTQNEPISFAAANRERRSPPSRRNTPVRASVSFDPESFNLRTGHFTRVTVASRVANASAVRICDAKPDLTNCSCASRRRGADELPRGNRSFQPRPSAISWPMRSIIPD